MSTGDRIVICTACGQSYYFQNGHTFINNTTIESRFTGETLESVPDPRLGRIIELLEAILERLKDETN